MKFPWSKYKEIKVGKRNTLQIFITNKCNLKCEGCFVENIIFNNDKDISIEEYKKAVLDFINKGGKQINLLGGEPFLHPQLLKFLMINNQHGLKTTIYTNGYYLDKYNDLQLNGAKLRVSIYSYEGNFKNILNIEERFDDRSIDINIMVSKETTVEELLKIADRSENYNKCKVFFISSLRALDNERKEFFDDINTTMPVLKYKELVHDFLNKYNGNMDIHVSKRGVFESTVDKCIARCRFANYFIGGKIIQCPYDIVNKKYQDDYQFNNRFCQHNNTCLMSKVIYRKIHYENYM